MEAWKKNEILREYGCSDSDIINELVQYMSSDDLDDFADHCAKAIDMDFDDYTEI